MTVRKKRPPLSAAQMEIMNVVWDCGEATVGDVLAALLKRRKVARNTVQTMLVRLEQKGWLRRRREGRAFLYSASVEREGTLQSIVDRLVDTAFAGSVDGLVMALLDGRGITDEEQARIQAMIEDARKRQP